MSNAKKQKSQNAALVNKPREGEPWPLDEAWSFVDHDSAWYAKAVENNKSGGVSLGIYCGDGGTLGEFSCYWPDFGGAVGRVFKMEIFSDAAQVAAKAPGLVMAILEGGRRWDDKEAFLGFLKESGFYDLTSKSRDEDVKQTWKDQAAMQAALEEARQIGSSIHAPAAKKTKSAKSL